MYRIDNVNLEEEERIIVSRLIGSLVKLDDVASVLLVGSIVKSKGVYKQKKSGIDLIVLINEKSSDYKIIKRLREVGLDFYLSDDIFILKGTLIIVLAERLYCHKMKIYNPGFKHILKQKNFLRRFDLNDIDLKNVYTIKMKEILEKLNELYKEGKN